MKTVNCPQCGKESLYSNENPARPFCSERCKLIDLGEWANESYKVPEKNASESVNDPNIDDEDFQSKAPAKPLL